MRWFTLIVSALFVAIGIVMIRDGAPWGWAITAFFAACALVAVFEPKLRIKYKTEFRLVITADEIACEHRRRPRESIRWSDVIRIWYVTTSHGPRVPDEWLLLEGANGGCSFPTEAEGMDAIWDELKQRFPNFDYRPLIEVQMRHHRGEALVLGANLTMSKIYVRNFGVSIDGFGAGAHQSLEHPLGVGGDEMMAWFRTTRTFRSMFGQEGGATGIDDQIAARGMEGLGAWILGRNMFGPVRGPWPDDQWKGWWGNEPPYHTPVFVLTHHARAPLEMAGGTVFHFVTDGIESALAQAKAAAGGRDIRIGGGVSTVRQYLQARLIDDLHVSIAPVLLGSGEHLLHGIDLPALGYEVAKSVAGEHATHVFVRKRT